MAPTLPQNYSLSQSLSLASITTALCPVLPSSVRRYSFLLSATLANCLTAISANGPQAVGSGLRIPSVPRERLSEVFVIDDEALC